MRSKILFTIAALCLSAASFNANAKDAKYTLEYDSASPIKDVVLKDANLKLKVYKSDNPAGYEAAKTDAEGSFTLDAPYDLEVVSIEGEDKHKAHCSGSGTIDDPKIRITCVAAETASE